MKYDYVKIITGGEDYIWVKYGKKECPEISGQAIEIIKILLKKIHSL